jgi:hypothetical protein
VIYEYPDSAAPVRQGDIFLRLPRVEVSLGKIPILESGGALAEADWEEIAASGEAVNAVLPIRPVTAIVISQDCDTVHGADITLCEVRPFRAVERMSKDTTSPKSWMKLLTQHARINLKWYYLPPDDQVGFGEKMAVDFTVAIRVPRIELEQFRAYRRGRLNPTADEHFRERLSEFFRRYPYDEWYPLDPAELGEYKKIYPEIEGYPWQVPANRASNT